MLYTLNIRESIDYYVGILGFTCEDFAEEWGWASLSHDQISVMLSKPNEHQKFNGPHFTGSIYFRMTGVDKYYQEIKDRVDICYPIETFHYGMREFGIYDINRYLLQFGEPRE
ncbi:MAG: bleomycin resistance family protein [Saprospiraceae bacterium]|nr:bleomycin resistance family protein [Saprospiraceae bacterium]